MQTDEQQWSLGNKGQVYGTRSCKGHHQHDGPAAHQVWNAPAQNMPLICQSLSPMGIHTEGAFLPERCAEMALGNRTIFTAQEGEKNVNPPTAAGHPCCRDAQGGSREKTAQKRSRKQGMLGYACDSSTQEAAAGGWPARDRQTVMQERSGKYVKSIVLALPLITQDKWNDSTFYKPFGEKNILLFLGHKNSGKICVLL